LPGMEHDSTPGESGLCPWQRRAMTPLPVVAQRPEDHCDPNLPHGLEPAIQVPDLLSLTGDVGAWASRVEAAGDWMLRPRTSKVLRQKVRMAEGMPEEIVAALVQVLPVDEHHHPRCGVSGKGSDCGIRHSDKKSPGHPLLGEAGAREPQPEYEVGRQDATLEYTSLPTSPPTYRERSPWSSLLHCCNRSRQREDRLD
jgi:hypothetical protein